jgi:C-terminal processing protease CtpA/Prc
MKEAIITIALLALCAGVTAEPLKGSVSVNHIDAKIKTASRYEVGYIGIREDWERKIIRIHPGSPAELAGLKIDDKVIQVDGSDKKDYPITGPAGTKVLVKIQRGTQTMFFDIERVPRSQIKPY